MVAHRHEAVEAAGGIQTGGVDGVYHRVPLHIRMEKPVDNGTVTVFIKSTVFFQ